MPHDPHVILHRDIATQLAQAPDATHLFIWHTLAGRTAWPINAWQVGDLEVIGWYGDVQAVVVPTDSTWQILALDRVDIKALASLKLEAQIEAAHEAEMPVADEPEYAPDANARAGFPGTRL